MRHKIIILSALSLVVVIAFLFFIPVVYTTLPPPMYHTNCTTPCAPYIATHVYGSITYRFFGIGGIIPGDWANWQYYSVYVG
ncbi:MAG: hypothetical protein JRN20_14605 [Nitrososphaerota archaeon]|jgi:hypothetical protein|nr:hypothetical protein [Nitrososphaerota archaeon]